MYIQKIVETVIDQFALSPWGMHGVAHWARVMENGLWLAEQNKANPDVIILFALFHDSKRICENEDPEHGRRGAEWAASLHGILFNLDLKNLENLITACTYHTGGGVMGDITVQTCWDADRLDLGRYEVLPDPARLYTDAAKRHETITLAYQHGVKNNLPRVVRDEWNLVIPACDCG